MSDFLIHTDAGDTYCLEHHGVLGQKWGIRRFQNEDGTLTDEGRRHYGMKDLRGSTDIKEISKNYARGFNNYQYTHASNRGAVSEAEFQRNKNQEKALKASERDKIDKAFSKQDQADEYERARQLYEEEVEAGKEFMKAFVKEATESGAQLKATKRQIGIDGHQQAAGLATYVWSVPIAHLKYTKKGGMSAEQINRLIDEVSEQQVKGYSKSNYYVVVY